jgi:hypothetical protein
MARDGCDIGRWCGCSPDPEDASNKENDSASASTCGNNGDEASGAACGKSKRTEAWKHC